MADLTITVANVLAGSDAVIEQGTFGATMTQGQPAYRAAATKKYGIADANSATAEVRVPRGITLNAGADGQPGSILRSGDITIGATLVAGTTYCLSATAGLICPQADLTTGDDVVVLGVAKSTTVLHVDIQVPGVTL